MLFAPLLIHRHDSVPSNEVARQLAEQILESLLTRPQHCEPANALRLDVIVRDQGFPVAVTTLNASQGGTQALMSPCGNGFMFLVDPEPTPAEAAKYHWCAPASLRQLLINRRLAHELAHALFYGQNGLRLRPTDPSEEAFCDLFAEALIREPAGSRAA